MRARRMSALQVPRSSRVQVLRCGAFVGEGVAVVDFGVRCVRVGVVAGRSVGVGAGGIGVGVGLTLQCW